MRRYVLGFVLCCLVCTAESQTTSSDALLTRTRALYDAPFTRDLVSFDCAVQFDWKKHFVDLLGNLPVAAVPPAVVSTADRLQTVQHRVFVSRSGAVVSAEPKAPDFTGVANGAQLEQIFNTIVSGGLNAWLPFSTSAIFPVEPTKFSFEKTEPGYKLVMKGADVEATLLLDPDLRLTSAVSQLPQPMRFATEFAGGPDGLVLASVKTATASDAATAGEASFAYTYQTVLGFQIPSLVTVAPTPSEAWHYALTDCKIVRAATIRVGPPQN